MSAYKSLKSEVTMQLKMVSKCIETSLHHIKQVDLKMQQSGQRAVDADNAQLKVLNIQQNLFDVLFVNFQYSLNESIETYVKSLTESSERPVPSTAEVASKQLAEKKKTQIRSKLVGFHKQKLTSLCKHFGFQVPRTICLQLPRERTLVNAERLNATVQAALQLGAVVSWSFFPHFTSAIVRVGEEPAIARDDEAVFPCTELHVGTPVVPFEWLTKSLSKGNWMPIRYAAANRSAPSSTPSVTPLTPGLIKSIDFVPRKRSASVQRVPTAREALRYSDDELGTDEEVIQTGSTACLENALRLFEEQVDRPSSHRGSDDEETFLATQETPPKRFLRADLRKPSISDTRPRKQSAMRISHSDLARYSDAIPEPRQDASSVAGRGTAPLESQVVQYVHARPPTPRKPKGESTFCFQFTAASPSGDLLDAISSLGAAFDIGPKCSPAATHLVVSGPPQVKSEKLLGFAIQGKWLVSEQFLLDSGRSGDFVHENAYEMYQDGSYGQYLRETKHRPFAGWSVLLLSAKESHKSMASMLTLGGAAHVTSSARRRTRVDFTHVLYDSTTLASPVPPAGDRSFYEKAHEVLLPSTNDVQEKVRSGRVVPVCLEYILDLFSAFCDEGALMSGVRQPSVGNPDIELALSIQTLKNMARLIVHVERS